MQKQEAPQRREDDLYIIEDRELFRRGISVSGSDGELPHCRRQSGKYQYHPLSACHGDISRNHERQREKAGEQRKACDYDRCLSPFSACTSYEYICGTCSETAIQADQRGYQSHIGAGRPDNEQRTDKSDDGSSDVRSGWFFL